MKMQKGDFIFLDNVLPFSDHIQNTLVRSHDNDVLRVLELDLSKFQMILSKDQEKVKKLWNHFLGHLYLSLNSKKLLMFAGLEEYALKALCKMCDFHIYQTGADIDLYNGGVIFHGAMKRKGAEESDSEGNDEGKVEENEES